MVTFADTCRSECCVSACFLYCGKEIWRATDENAKRKG
jgi:hypothetical protein